jgi:penicillin-binding protein 1A
MSDYFERLEVHLLDAVEAAAPTPAPRARRARPPRPVRASAWVMVASVVAVALAVVLLATALHHRGAAPPRPIGTAAPTIDGVAPRVPAALSEVLASNGAVLGYIGAGTTRTVLAGVAVPRLLRDATRAAEGPSLSLELAGLLYFPPGEHDLAKVARIARGLVAARSETWIADEYLNVADYGRLAGKTAIGAQAASRLFFGKPVSKLNLAQTALLAALPDDHVLNAPLRMAAARRRRAAVLSTMVAAHAITPAAAADAEHTGLQLHPNAAYPSAGDAALVAYVAQRLGALVPAGVIARGGLVIHTTIEPHDQTEALSALRRHVGPAAGPVGALASIDPVDGHIVALADSRPVSFNYGADVARQPGSAFTVFALGALIHDEDGDPTKTFYDSHFLAPGWLPGYPTYSVRDDEDSYQGRISVARAVATADNTVFAQLGADLGAAKIGAMAHAMGITAPFADVPSEPLGGLTTGVSPLQMADAYATLANGGVHIAPTIISAVTLSDGSTTTAPVPTATRVLSIGEAAEATHVLRTVITSGTGTAASYGCPAAGKTGSTSDLTDAWFVGYTPTLATSAWVGSPDGRPMMNGFGGVLAAPIWRDYMEVASPPRCMGPGFSTGPWSGRAYPGAHTAGGAR